MKQKLRILMVAAAIAALPMMASAGPVLIVNNAAGTSEAGTTNAITTNLSALHAAAGNTVTIVSDLPASLAGYSQVWDIGFDNNAALTVADQALYTAYLAGGGGVFLMGENASFMSRNNSILALIASLGGGSIGFNGCFDGVQTVRAPFNNPNPVSQVDFAASGCFTSTGSGDWITARADDSLGAGLAFGVGDLSGAMAGALTTILDVNFMMNSFDLPNSQNLTRNLIQFVGDQVDPPADIPEPESLALVGLALAGAAFARRRRGSVVSGS
jgi:hypothetical protein